MFVIKSGNQRSGLLAEALGDSTNLAWRNLVVHWHLQRRMTDCGCDDETAAIDYCRESAAWATTYIGSGTLSRI